MKAIKNKVTAPAMTRAEWEAEAEGYPGFVDFCPWERMRKPETVKRVGPPAKAREGWKYFTEAGKR